MHKIHSNNPQGKTKSKHKRARYSYLVALDCSIINSKSRTVDERRLLSAIKSREARRRLRSKGNDQYTISALQHQNIQQQNLQANIMAHPRNEKVPVPRYVDFETTGDPFEYIQRINLYDNTHNWDGNHKLAVMPLYLEGKASVWWRQRHALHGAENWAQRSQAFIDYFRGPDYQRRMADQFMSIKQIIGEDVETYHWRFSQKYVAANNGNYLTLQEGAQVNRFIDGLLPNLQEAVEKGGPATMEDCLRLVRAAERYD